MTRKRAIYVAIWLCAWLLPLTGRIAVAAQAAAAAPAAGGDTAAIHVPTADEIETELWDLIKNSRDPSDFENYLTQYPNGRFAPLAKQHAKNLRATGGSTAPTPGSTATPAGSAETTAEPTTATGGSTAAPHPDEHEATGARSPASAEEAPEKPRHRGFPVAEKRTLSWCYGYLNVMPDTVRYEVLRPKDCEGSSFEARRSEVHAGRWTVLGQPQQGIELRAAGSTRILQWLNFPEEVESGPTFRLAPPRSLSPDLLLDLLHGKYFKKKDAGAQAPAPAVAATTGNAPAAEAAAPNASATAAQNAPPSKSVSPARPYDAKATKLLQNHQFKEAIDAYNMAIAADPNDPDAYFGLGTALASDALVHNKDPAETAAAAEKFRKYLELAPNGVFADASKKSLDAMGFPVSSAESGAAPDAAPTSTLALPAGRAAGDSFAEPLAGPVGPLRLNAGVGYVAPVGWSVSQDHGMAVMSPPMPESDTPCVALLLPPQAAQADMVAQAYAIANQLFAARFGRLTGDLGRDIRQSLYQGVSGKGWEYVELFGILGDERRRNDGRILLTRMGNQVVALAAVTKSGKCLGNRYYRANDNWALLFHSLRLPGYAEDSPLLQQQLLGQWESVGSTTFSSKTYAANGHFGRMDAHATYTESSRPGFVLQKTSSWEGDGTYEVHGDRLTSHPNTGQFAGRTITELFSIMRRANTQRPGGFEWVLQVVSRSDTPTQGTSGNGNFVYTLVKEQ